MRKPILALDFDGVIHSYTSGWQGADVISDPPVPGAMEFIDQAVEKFQVCIFSSRSHQPGGIDAMKMWLTKHFAEWLRETNPKAGIQYFSDTMDEIQWPLNKPPAMVSIDDRGLTFTGTWPTIESLLAFTPWNKKP